MGVSKSWNVETNTQPKKYDLPQSKYAKFKKKMSNKLKLSLENQY